MVLCQMRRCKLEDGKPGVGVRWSREVAAGQVDFDRVAGVSRWIIWPKKRLWDDLPWGASKFPCDGVILSQCSNCRE